MFGINEALEHLEIERVTKTNCTRNKNKTKFEAAVCTIHIGKIAKSKSRKDVKVEYDWLQVTVNSEKMKPKHE